MSARKLRLRLVFRGEEARKISAIKKKLGCSSDEAVFVHLINEAFDLANGNSSVYGKNVKRRFRVAKRCSGE